MSVSKELLLGKALQHCTLRYLNCMGEFHNFLRLFYLTFLNNPSLDMESVLSMMYIASLMTINPVNPRKNMQSGLHMKR